MKLKGRVCKLVVILNPKLFFKYVIYTEEGKVELYVEVPNALYGLLQSVLRLYAKLVTNLKSMVSSQPR